MEHGIIPEFLGEGLVAGLLGHVSANQSRFASSRVLEQSHVVEAEGHVDAAVRISSRLADLGAFREQMEQRLLDRLPGLVTDLGLKPFDPTRIELQLVAHGDGAFYKTHIDTFSTADGSAASRRVISAIYYFSRLPKGYSGGELRLYDIRSIGDNLSAFTDIEPRRDCLVYFSAWQPHEVRPVRCPSGEFMDSRFAINCWIHEKTGRQGR